MKLKTLLCLTACLAFSTAVITAEAQQAKKATPSRNKATATQTKKPATSADVEYVARVSAQPLPFSDVVRVGNILYLSGQLGVDDQGALVAGGIQPETRRIMERIKRLVEQNSSSMSHVVKCTCMLADMSEWAAMNEVYVTFFEKDRRPARSAFGVSALARNARVEIECIATVK